MANVLKREKQLMVLRLLVEGNGLRSIERITGVQKKTAARLMVRFGNACKAFMDDELRGLSLRHIELDEMHTYVGQRQKNLKAEDRRVRHDRGELYLWTALCQDSKLVPCFALGKRTGDNARRFLVDLASRLNLPSPHATDDHTFFRGREFQPVCQLSSDAFAGYSEAVDLAFGGQVRYGQLIKNFRNADRKAGDYSPADIIATQRRLVYGMKPGEEWQICTSHIERHNLTVRTFLARFQRLSLKFSKKLENLAAAVSIFLCYYNWAWRPRHTDQSGKPGQLRVTPAMSAGITSRLWKMEDLFAEIEPRYM